MTDTGHHPVIEIAGLTKRFGRFTALDGLDLTVNQGEVHGFLGPNGAGKSTTLRVLLGILRAGSGSVRLFGRDPWRDAVALHRELAYVPGDVTLWPTLSGGETIDLLARMRGGIDAGRRGELVERFGLDPHKKARAYSKGNRQKVALISAFASDVRLLLLDEPTSGLDPLMEQVFRECAREAQQRGVTVLLSSHILSEVEALCDRVTIIREGRTVESGSLARMRHLSRTAITVELTGDPGDLAALPGVADVRRDGDTVRLQVDAEHLGEVIRVLGEAGVRSLVSAPPTLEELFLRHYHTEPGSRDDERGSASSRPSTSAEPSGRDDAEPSERDGVEPSERDNAEPSERDGAGRDERGAAPSGGHSVPASGERADDQVRS